MIDELTKIINKRQSIFPNSFTGEIIENSTVEMILRNANKAPSHKNTEPWRFHIVSGESKLKLEKFAQESYKSSIPKDKFKESKYLKLAKKMANSSHIIFINMQRDAEASVPEWEELAAVSCAVQNLALSVAALSLGGYWSSPQHLIDNVHQFINMSLGEKCLGLYYLGIPKDDIPPIKVKKPIEDKTKWYL